MEVSRYTGSVCFYLIVNLYFIPLASVHARYYTFTLYKFFYLTLIGDCVYFCLNLHFNSECKMSPASWCTCKERSLRPPVNSEFDPRVLQST